MSTEQQLDLLALSDEEFAKLDPSQFGAPAMEEPAEEAADATSTDAAVAEEGATGAEAADEGDQQEETEQGGQVADPVADAGKPTEVPKDKAEVPESDKAEKDDKPADGIDYKAAYERITAPFKANGKEMRITDVEDVVQLMQMGANYNVKMARLKPNLQILKTLENHGLLDQEKLSFLIDLSKKDKGAIEKLVKDSGIDPLDMDVGKANDYKPKTYTADEREIELDSVLEKIQDTPTYAKIVSLVSNKWDAASKQAVANAPQLLEIINDHMASGVYDLISTEVERERMLGRLTGMSDLQAYNKIGDAIQARGGFDHLSQAQPSPVPAPAPVVRKPVDPGLKDRRRAAGSTSAAPTPAPKPDFNPLAMSDAEFEKQMNAKFL